MGVVNRLRNSFIAGLILVAPLAVTVFVLQFVFVRVTGMLNPLVREMDVAAYTGNIQILAQILTAVLLVLAITTLGYLASRSVGERLFGSFERAVGFIPVVRTVYFGVRQVGESLAERSSAYESVVLVEYPREGLYSIGFVTNHSPRAMQSATGERLYNVFLPNSPNPTAGRLVLVPEADVRELDVPVRRGLRLLITTGLSVDDIEELPEGVVR